MRCPPPEHAGRRRGFTVVQMMVLVLVVGAAFGWFLMAVVRSREAARRSQCISNLKQWGLAVANYESAWGTYPMGYVSQISPGGPGRPPAGSELGTGWAWGTAILPFMGVTDLYNAVNFWTPMTGPEAVTVRRSEVRTFLCPTEVRNGPASFHAPRPMLGLPTDLSPSSYVACAGTTIDATTGDSDGGFGRNVSRKPTDILDGVAQTIMLGERSRALSDATWTGVVPDGLVPGVQHCANPSWPVRSCGPVWGMVLGVTDLPAGTPNPTIGLSSPRADQTAFSGPHAGGVAFVFFDDSVRFIKDSIAPGVYRSLATRAGLKDDGDDSY